LKEGIGKRKKSKGGLEGSMLQLVGGWVCYSLVLELLVEALGQYGTILLVRVSWLRSKSDREVEKLRRSGVAESTQEIERQRSIEGVRRIVTIPPSNSGEISTVGSREIQDHWFEGQVNRGRLMKRKQGLRSQPSDPMGERYQQKEGIAGNQVAWEIFSQRGAAIQTMILTEWFCVIVGRIVGRKVGSSKPLMRAPTN
jgi:hypothetical protein